MGRTKLYGEETVAISLKVPESKKDFYKQKFYSILKGNENGNANSDLLDKLVLLMVKAGITSEEHGIDINESDIEPSIKRLMESGKIG